MPVENQIFWNNLQKIKERLLFSDCEFADFLDLPFNIYLKTKERRETFSLFHMSEVADKLKIHLADFVDPNFEFNGRLFMGSQSLPDRYCHATFSTMRPVMNILSYIEKYLGFEAKRRLLRKFQVDDSLIFENGAKTNIHLITDFLNYLSLTNDFQTEDFIAMGQMMPEQSANSILKEKVAGSRSVEELYEILIFECTHLFDVNCTYKLVSLKNSEIIIDAIPNSHALSELSLFRDQFGSEELCHTRMGVFSSMPRLKYSCNGIAKKIESVFEGGTHNRYKINFGNISFHDPLCISSGPRRYH